MKRESLERRCQKMKARNEAALRPQTSPLPYSALPNWAAMVARGTVPLIKVKDVAKRIGMSPLWVRKHFENVPGVVAFRSPKRGVRVYTILLIPENILVDELRKFSVRLPV